MNTTATAVRSTPRPLGWTTVVGGLGVTAAGIVAAVDASVADSVWFGFAGASVLLSTAGVVGLHRAASDVPVARTALGAAAVTMTLFGLAHFYAVVDQDRAIPFFSAFMLLSALGLVVAGVALVRARRWRPTVRALPLVTGLWPLTIPIGLAIGDVPHFLAIAIWGLCWTAIGRILLAGDLR
ncbi:hypothetical protein GCM10009630_35710 [Kribbella jejuensis]|uniref:Uncharacterized protein n=1 Tax=Kribbella jejuensis TaxID=236068 RepID=A0A542DAU7_9ACTN|nr:hypothetical protein [Kribbella jejuensis]TQJ00199.1 hypothetical protein FB475_7192 [Kribbella jejuensis]